MKFRFQRKYFEILSILILGLVPLLWFQGDKIVLGHDAGLTLSPLNHFLDRLFSWTYRFGFGSDQSYALPGFFIHGLEALVFSLTNSVQLMQKIVFIFWFVLPGLSMYYLASKLEKRLKVSYLALPAALFYMFNHFLLQGWFIAERAKFSLYIAAPIMLSLLLDWKDNRRGTLRTAIYLSMLFLFFNGLASIPLFGGILILLSIFVVLYLIEHFTFNSIKKLFTLLFLSFLFSLLLQAYWLLPYGRYVLGSYAKSVEFFGGVEGILEWIKYISINSSYINLLRLQGVPEWYQNPLHPYAKFFLTNPFLLLVSFILPILAFGSLLLYKERKARKILLFLSISAIVSIVLAAGSHPPFGFVYLLLVKYVPGFIAFRTPFYKFSSSLWFSYALLFSFSVSYLISKFKNRKMISVGFYAFICAGILVYNFPFFTGNFFDYIQGVRSMRVKVPSYIYEFGKWSETPSRIGKRTILLPSPNMDSMIESYSWGYWSLAPLTSLLSNAPIVNVSAYTTKDERTILAQLYILMKNNDPDWIKLAKILNLQSIVLRNDFDWRLQNSPTDSPSAYRNVLRNTEIKQVKKFGEWIVYDILPDKSREISSSKNLTLIEGGADKIATVLSLPIYNYENPFYLSGQNNNQLSGLYKYTNEYILNSQCVMCDMQWGFVNTLAYTPTLTRSSFLYPFIEARISREEKKAKSDPNVYLQFLAYKSLTHVLSMQKIIDQKIKLKAINNTQQDYLKRMNAIKNLLKDSSESIKNETIVELLSVLRTNKVIMKQIIEQLPQKAVPPIQSTILSLLDIMSIRTVDVNKIALKKGWLTTNENEKRMLVEAPLSGNYEMFYKPNKVIPDTNMPEYQINNNKFNTGQIITDSKWVDLGSFPLQKGVNKIQINQSPSVLYSNQNNVILNDKSNNCFVSSVYGSNRNDVFIITFKHRNFGQNNKYYVAFLENNKKFDTKEQIELSSFKNLTDYENTYLSISDKGLKFVICMAKTTFTESSTLEISQLRFIKMDIPDVVFYRKDNSDETSQDPYKKINQTKFITSNNSNSRVLTLNESFNGNWKINTGAVHFVADGYSNGWVISSPKKNYIIEYALQKVFYIGAAMTIISFIGMLLVIFKFKK